MQIILVVVGIVILLGLVVWLAVAANRKMIARLAALAQRQGLTYHPAKGLSDPFIEGQRHGRRVRIWTFSTGSGKSRQGWIAAGVEPRALREFTFDLRPQGLGSKFATLFGAKEAVTGDRAFDERWFLQTNAPEALAPALIGEIRAQLDAAYAAGARGHFRTEKGLVCYVEPGGFYHEPALTRIESLLPLLNDLADVAEVCAESR